MKFKINLDSKKENRLLTYSLEEYGFNIEPKVDAINFGLVINFLDLTVINDEKKVVEVLGFCGYKTWIRFNKDVPQYQEGALYVTGNLEPGFSYRIYKEEQPIYVNIQAGWICVGNPEGLGNAVEFINNCVAVIDGNNDFVSLWLKPPILPPLKIEY